MSRLRPVHFVVAGAFALGVVVTLLLVVAFGSNSKPSELASSAPVVTASPPLTRTTSTSPTPNVAPTLVVIPIPPSIPGSVVSTPPAGGFAQVLPGACTQSSAGGYLTQALPPLQQLGGSYDAWSHAPIVTASAQMHSLQQILGGFDQSFEAIAPVPEGCAFIHYGVVQASKDLIEVAGKVDFSNTPALHGGWEAEYRGRASNMKNAIDLYVSATGITLTPRPFGNVNDLASP